MSDSLASLQPHAARMRAAAAEFARLSLGFVPVVLLLRVYERVMTGALHTLPAASLMAWLRAIASDLALVAWLAVVLVAPVLAVALASPAAARVVHRAALVLVALLGVALAQYFAVTLVPLGADFYGYSWSDIRETVSASRGVSWLSLLPFALFGAAAWYVPGLTRRFPMPTVAGATLSAIALALVVLPSILLPAPTAFSSDTAWFVTANKTGWFGQRSAEHLASQWRVARAAASLRGYPLMHRVTYDDVLGPQLALGAQPPNIVMVVVEGLGRDFTGPRAEYGGFTPFLDSLADRSMSWDNFLSTSGRTFGIFPSLLGSLPFGANGFMELGAGMPGHVSLVGLLKRFGYSTSYFTGTNGAFDHIDQFMERQGVDRFVDASGFGPSYVRQPAEPGGESWGYPDDALFRRSLELIGPASDTPRLDVYLTITTHEPFIPPREAVYHARFERRLAQLALTDARRAAVREQAGIFETLLYVDDALRDFLGAYATRADYGRTIFIITGDHRMIPMPPAARIARYHVPFIVYSPMLRTPHHIGAVSSHLDVAPSLLALLQRGYGMMPPDSAAWLGSGLDTATSFRHVNALSLMRTKNELDDYLDGTNFLSGNRLYRLDSTFTLRPSDDDAARRAAAAKLDRFRAVNHFVTTGEHLMPGIAAATGAAAGDRAREDSAYHALGLEGRTAVEAFDAAKALAAKGEYAAARLVVRRLLRDTPSYHDARALLGRTYGWERRFEEARPILDDLVRRAPSYVDGYVARIDLDIWQGNGAPALATATRMLATFPRNPDLLYAQARALELLQRRAEALAVLDELRRVAPAHAEAAALRARLQAP